MRDECCNAGPGRCEHGTLEDRVCAECEADDEKREQARKEFDAAAIDLANWLNGSEIRLEATQIVLSRAVTLGLIDAEEKS